MASNSSPLTFFGYWSGQLPAITDLHFRSFLRHHPESRYELWWDEEEDSTITVPELQWIKTHPRITVRPFSLNRLIEQHVSARPVAHYDRWLRIRKVVSALHRKLAPQWAHGRAWNPPLFGLTYKHSSTLFCGFTSNKAYRSDLARCLIPLVHYPDACLYTDLDVCFTSDLTERCADTAWVYRWDHFDFANSAIMFLPNRTWSAALVHKGNELENFLPWILFTDHICNELGITVHPTELFDPLWNAASILQGSEAKFFCPRESLALDMQTLSNECHWAIHWHNNWKTVPAPTSIYSGLLQACQAADG